ncbi:antiviral reverse transcriptase Drt3b [Octadecabacter antarcticus]|uniref:antiviral reverse transcriptase Drt3b n=1 Tax=Octadecabacter antarcticus TaxID=1217908 RepID=UPI001651410D|nr:antiviral reverse transcriptase Drt3b [Octadecabacter antarcticus]
MTETLPYEVPVTFSNEFLFVSELRKSKLSDKALNFLNGEYRRPLKAEAYTIPFNYQIRKGARGFNTLSIVHPLHQIRMASFLVEYSHTIISECSESLYSLRAPYKVLPEVSKDEMKKVGKAKKLDLAHVAPQDGRLDINFAPSFFSVRKHNLLDKFYGSNELLRLESRFQLLRKMDVTKCFFNIYTHSVTWAVKGKPYSKEQANKYTFEGRFDTLMQRSNYNETNGIVVGPEISRVFAEVIFQRIDRNIISRMDERLHEGRDYTIRRYVDDFFLFARNEAVLDELNQAVETCLEEYKLFPNEGKLENLRRPFVTNITQAKQGIRDIATRLVSEAKKPLTENEKEQTETRRNMRNLLEELRLVVRDTDASFSEVTGPIYFQIGQAVKEVLKAEGDLTTDKKLDAINRVRSILRILFYSLASDFRVAPIYKAFQVLERLKKFKVEIGESESEALNDYIIYEITELVSTYKPEKVGEDISLEMCNLLLLGASVSPDLFLSQAPVIELCTVLLRKKSMGYFSFIAMIFLLAHASPSDDYKKALETVSKLARKRVRKGKTELRTSSEVYLMFSDIIGCPHIKVSERKALIKEVCGVGDLSDDDINTLAKHVAFVDWDAGRTSHFLRRKQLQPVYSAV